MADHDDALVEAIDDRSIEQADLFKGLIKFQGTIRTVEADAENPHFGSKFASLGAMWEAIKGPLSEADLCLIQEPETSRDGIMLRSTLGHSSGQWRSSRMFIPVSEKGAKSPQAFGSALSYAKRYAAGAILGVASTSEDVDGSGAVDKVASYRAESPLEAEQKSWVAWCDAKINSMRQCQGQVPLDRMLTSFTEEYARAPTNVQKRLDNTVKELTKQFSNDNLDEDIPQ